MESWLDTFDDSEFSTIPFNKTYPNTPSIINAGLRFGTIGLSWISAILFTIVLKFVITEKSQTNFLLLWLTVFDFFTLTGRLFVTTLYVRQESYPEFSGSWFCKCESAFTSWMSMTSFLLTIVISFHLFGIELERLVKNVFILLFASLTPRKY